MRFMGLVFFLLTLAACAGVDGLSLPTPTPNGFTITPSGDDNETIAPSTPQTVTAGATQSFTVTANSGFTVSNSVGGTCPAGSWSASVYTTGAITASCTVTFSAAHTYSGYAYIVNSPITSTDYTVSICPVSRDGASLGICSVSEALDSGGVSTLNQPFAIALNPAQTKVYIANQTALTGANACPGGQDSIAICPINSDESLGVCASACDPSFNTLTGVAFSPDGSTLVASNYGSGSVSLCPVNADGTLQPCTTSNGPNTTCINFSYTEFIGVQTAGNGSTYLYTMANGNQRASAICLLEGGAITSCTMTDSVNIDSCPTGQLTYLSAPQGIGFNAANTVAYFGNADATDVTYPNGYVSICPLDINGAIGSCTQSGGPDSTGTSTFKTVSQNGVGLVMSSQTGYGYIPNSNDPDNTISICQISPTDGSLSNCTVVPGNNSSGTNTLNGPNAIAFKTIQ